MKFEIKHECAGRIRLKICAFKNLNEGEFLKEISKFSGVKECRFNAKIGALVINYDKNFTSSAFKNTAREGEGESEGSRNSANSRKSANTGTRDELIKHLANLDLAKFKRAKKRERSHAPSKNALIVSAAALGANFFFRNSAFVRLFSLIACLPLLKEGAKESLAHGLTSKTLEALAAGISFGRADTFAANSTNTMLALGEYMEESTVYKSDDLIKELAKPDISEAWVEVEQNGEKIEMKIPASKLKTGDIVVVRSGDIIGVDGHILSGEALINQSSMTGEALPARKSRGDSVLSGTIVAEGKIRIWAESVGDETSAHSIKKYIANALKERSQIGARAMRLGDKLVPITFGLAGVSYLINRNFTSVASVLQADYSCALKLPTPVAFKSSISKAGKAGILIKGAKALESLGASDTFVFDKTGTLTHGNLEVVKIISFDKNFSDKDILNLTASAEEHYFHPVAQAIVEAAKKRGFIHVSHDEVEFVVAHGVKTNIEGKILIIGSKHFLQDDEMIDFAPFKKRIENLENRGLSLLFIAFDGKLLGVIGLRDRLRDNAKFVISQLRKIGVKQIIMLSGDVKQKADEVARELGLDAAYGELLPTQKTEIIKDLQSRGHKVTFIGDGINDAPSLMAADVGIGMPSSAHIAKASAQILLLKNDIEGVAKIKAAADDTLRLIRRNFNATVGVNSVILLLATLGILSPISTAILHNGTTIALLLNSIKGAKFEK
ncbi:heavy metal translocating P-type ATPase [Campylobacter sp. VBCF_08 NA3]|uniref:heavy metal translocating P-type ATPase n=1 Tax=Campylobacter sp. VBCF_08 NA3 TaxID=2983833 RepID=UPI0022E9DC23|nr:heavy metal translocating P-type ATPase [Campylobacter sp. VBCF_08 NA3]MDA3069860.1 heavy metal translocating P-type ATPase [Campylobacter sp. VBCF_08 NA3]